MVLDYDDICLCNSCRRIDAPMTFEWVGTCSCKGQDMGCFANPDNYRVTCPDCGVKCSAETGSKIDGRTGYGHVVWSCNWPPCGWYWG
jgi:hypothetical protein